MRPAWEVEALRTQLGLPEPTDLPAADVEGVAELVEEIPDPFARPPDLPI